MRQFLRYLRITWAVTCGIACVLLIALWVRSYWSRDVLYGPLFGGREFAVSTSTETTKGLEVLWYIPQLFGPQKVTWGFETNDLIKMSILEATIAKFGFGIYQGSIAGFIVPFWFLVLVSVATAGIPWLFRWRFTLRTLLLATTLVAVVLGFAVYVARK